MREVDTQQGSIAAASDPASDRARVIDAARQILGAAPAAAPHILILEDAHWADELSRAVIRSLARFPVAVPVLLVVVERSGDSSGIQTTDATGIELAPLGEGDVAQWAGRPADAYTARLCELTGGLPLLLHDVLQREPASTTQLPSSAGHRLLRDRSASLPSRTAATLLTAAVLGPSFRFDDILATSPGAEVALVEDLDAATRAGVLDYDRTDSDVFRFTHDLLRLAVLEMATPLRRMQLHARVLDAVGDLPPLTQVHHAQAAGRFVTPARLADLSVAAARGLLATFGFDGARGLIDSTLDSVGQVIDPVPRARLLTLLSRAEAALGVAAAARSHLQQAMAVAESADDPELLAEVVLAESLFGQERAQDAGAPARLTRLLEALPTESVHTRFQIQRQLVFAHINGGRLEESAALLPEARALAQRLGTASAEADLLYVEYLRCEFAGESAQRAALLARSQALLAVHKDPDLRARYLSMTILRSLHDGQLDEALRSADELTELGISAGDPYSEWLGLTARFSPLAVAGDLAGAHAAAERAWNRGSQSEIFFTTSTYGGQLFLLGWATGTLTALPMNTEAPDLDGPELAWRAVRALALALGSQPEAAAEELQAVRRLIPVAGGHYIGFIGLAFGVEAAVLLGATDVLALAEPLLRRRVDDHVILGSGQLDLGPVTRYLALVRDGLGYRDDAVALLREVHRDSRSGRLWQLRAAHDLARLGASVPGARVPETGTWSWLLPK